MNKDILSEELKNKILQIVKNKKFWLKSIVFVFALFMLSISLYGNSYKYTQLHVSESYRVYIDENYVGNISSIEKVEGMFQRKRDEYMMAGYNVDDPKNVRFEKVTSLGSDVSYESFITQMIDENVEFLVNGYNVYIDGNLSMSVLSEEDFNIATEEIVTTFVDDQTYYKLKETGETEKIEDVGVSIIDAYIDNEIEIQESQVSVDDVLKNKEEIKKYIMYGNLNDVKKYTVKTGDTIDIVASKNEMEVSEFLAVNPDLKYGDEILIVGEEVTVEVIRPIVDVVIIENLVQREPIQYDVETVVRSDLYSGIDNYTRQTGVNGEQRSSYLIKSVNGIASEAVLTGDPEVLQEPINEVRVVGTRNPRIGTGNWKWPSWSWAITSHYGMRRHPISGTWRMHYGTDIVSYAGSPIMAADNGVVTAAGWDNIKGYYVIINHNNGYWTEYMHMTKLYVSYGQTVLRGKVIGGMGTTGGSTGVHLHFEVSRGSYGNRINPVSLYY